jgi:hypothetical protein
MEGELDFCDGFELAPPVSLDVSQYNNLRLGEDETRGGSGCC